MPLISTSMTSPGTMSPAAPSVPIQSTSPGWSVAVLLISWIQVAVSQIWSPEEKSSHTVPLCRTAMRSLTGSSPVAIHGPNGLNVSQFFARNRVRSVFCYSRWLTSFPML